MIAKTSHAPAARTLSLVTAAVLFACGMSAQAATRVELHDQNLASLNKAYLAATAHLNASATPAGYSGHVKPPFRTMGSQWRVVG